MKLYYPIEVDLFRPYPLPIMEAQQNNIGRGAQVTLKANGAIIQPTNEGLTFWAKKAGRYGVIPCRHAVRYKRTA